MCGGRDLEDQCLKPVQTKSCCKPISTNEWVAHTHNPSYSRKHK
jgi:hypothetical protein